MSHVFNHANYAVVAQWLSRCAYELEEPGSNPPLGGNFKPHPWKHCSLPVPLYSGSSHVSG